MEYVRTTEVEPSSPRFSCHMPIETPADYPFSAELPFGLPGASTAPSIHSFDPMMMETYLAPWDPFLVSSSASTTPSPNPTRTWPEQHFDLGQTSPRIVPLINTSVIEAHDFDMQTDFPPVYDAPQAAVIPSEERRSILHCRSSTTESHDSGYGSDRAAEFLDTEVFATFDSGYASDHKADVQEEQRRQKKARPQRGRRGRKPRVGKSEKGRPCRKPSPNPNDDDQAVCRESAPETIEKTGPMLVMSTANQPVAHPTPRRQGLADIAADVSTTSDAERDKEEADFTLDAEADSRTPSPWQAAGSVEAEQFLARSLWWIVNGPNNDTGSLQSSVNSSPWNLESDSPLALGSTEGVVSHPSNLHSGAGSGASPDANSNPGSSSSSASNGSPGQKRTRDQNDPSREPDDGDGDDPSEKRLKLAANERPLFRPRFACPYQKFDPLGSPFCCMPNNKNPEGGADTFPRIK